MANGRGGPLAPPGGGGGGGALSHGHAELIHRLMGKCKRISAHRLEVAEADPFQALVHESL